MPKILIVEDDLPLANLYKEGLGKEGFEVEVSDDVSAIFNIKANRPDLVILDLLMPKVRGLSILKEIRENAQIGRTPVLILTNVEETAEMEQAVALGIAGYLFKSEVKMDNLARRVNSIFGRAQKSAS